MRLFSIGALALAVIAICVGGLLVEARRSDAEAAARARLTSIAENRSSTLVGYYSEIRADMAQAAGSSAVGRLADGATDAATRAAASHELSALEETLHQPLDMVAVVNLYGDTAAQLSRGHSSHPVPVPAAVWVSTPIAVGDMSASAPYVSAVAGEPVIAFSMRTSSENTAYVMLEVPMSELLQALRGVGSPARLRLIDPEAGVVVLDTGGAVGTLAPPRALTAALSKTEAVGTVREGRSMTAFLRPSFLGPGLSGTIGNWVLTATQPTALPTLEGSVSALSAMLVLLGVVVFVLALLGIRVSARRLERMASTDGLTSLGNRRALLRDLDACFKRSAGGTTWTLVLLDLDGFKSYNDAFGHAGGDNLLRRLAGRLEHFACDHGASAYRLGGDEFCVLAPTGSGQEVGLWAETALTETGEAFAVRASWGVAEIPGETRNPAGALKLADERMYAQKAGGRSSAARQVTEVVVSLLDEHEPGRALRLRELAELTEAVGVEFNLSRDALLNLRRATMLHRVGLCAVPSTILDKATPLTPEEQAFIRDHTTVADRVLAAAPSLRAVALLVRATSEAFDGSGHPDGLGGTSIPLASRIIAVCVAYAAMTEQRPYRPARSPAAALKELRRCAGSQFDPEVVAVLAAVLRSTGPASADYVTVDKRDRGARLALPG